MKRHVKFPSLCHEAAGARLEKRRSSYRYDAGVVASHHLAFTCCLPRWIFHFFGAVGELLKSWAITIASSSGLLSSGALVSAVQALAEQNITDAPASPL